MTRRLQRLFQRAVPEDWEKQLAEFSPPTSRFKWLKTIWEAGYPWEPVERFMIYEMVPSHGVAEEILEQLQDPHPPSMHGNYFDTVKDEFILNPDCLITERAWHMYRETGCWGRPYWVIQGDKGGHKRWFTRVEKMYLRLAGLPPAPPAPGDLPFAEPSDLVMKKLQQHDLLRGIHNSQRFAAGAAQDAWKAMEAEQEREFRKKLVEWLHDQVDASAGEIISALRQTDERGTPGISEADLEREQERQEQNFIETGRRDGRIIKLG